MGRHSLRPITIARIVEICSFASKFSEVSVEKLGEGLRVNTRRARELMEECCDMGVLARSQGGYRITPNGRSLLRFFDLEDWQNFRSYFHKNYPIYNRFLAMMQDQLKEPVGRTLDEILSLGSKIQPPLNRTAIDVLSKLAERLGDVQRHLYSARFYAARFEVSKKLFLSNLVQCYERLNVRRGVGLTALYVEIPRLREDTCEALKISRRQFDDLFLELYRGNIGTMELSGAPVTTKAKESRYAVRTLRRTIKEDMLAPKLDLEKERRGIDLVGKSYYYVALHSKPEFQVLS